jgi:hypothetical protein
MKRGQGMLRLTSIDDLQSAYLRARNAQREVPRLLETEVLPTVIEALRKHPRVAWVERVNKGFGRLERSDRSLSYPMFWGFKHALDLLGQLKDGRILMVEVKRPGERPDPEQQAVIDGVNAARGIAFCATNASEAFERVPA